MTFFCFWVSVCCGIQIFSISIFIMDYRAPCVLNEVDISISHRYILALSADV